MADAAAYELIFGRLVRDTRYAANLDWGAPRPGHPEGSIRAHIVELERNLEIMRPQLDEVQYWKLKLLGWRFRKTPYDIAFRPKPLRDALAQAFGARRIY